MSPDNDVQHLWWNGWQWNDWQPWVDSDSPAFGSAPAVSSAQAGQLDLVARDHAGSLLGRHYADGSWTPWQSLGAVPARQGETPGLVSWSNGYMTTMVRGDLEDGLWTADIRWPWAAERR